MGDEPFTTRNKPVGYRHLFRRLYVNSQTTRHGRLDDLETLQEIERAAGAVFTDYGMSVIAEDDPPSIESLAEYCQDDRLWVYRDESDHPVAYIIADVIDECGHIEQISVHPDYSSMRIGHTLIEAVADWASNRKLQAITLTTFSEIPWNAPYYERLGFEVIPEAEHSPGLQRVRHEERAHGLDRWPRVCMKRDIAESN